MDLTFGSKVFDFSPGDDALRTDIVHARFGDRWIVVWMRQGAAHFTFNAILLLLVEFRQSWILIQLVRCR
jgi:hypothetical protein